MEITPDEIAVRAYERFLARGGEHGHDVEDWLAATDDLRRSRQRYDVELLDPGPRVIELVRVLRDVTGVNLRDIGVIVDAPPGTLWRDVSTADAERLQAQLAELGATVALIPR
jgi:ribosomal protein L7/L12